MIDYNLLTTWAECDAATAELDFELLTFSARDINMDVADERGDRAQTNAVSQLAALDGKILAAQNLLAASGIAADLRETTTDDLALLQAQRTKLAKRGRQQAGVAPFLASVNAQQVEDQVATLTAAKAGVATRRAALSA